MYALQNVYTFIIKKHYHFYVEVFKHLNSVSVLKITEIISRLILFKLCN